MESITVTQAVDRRKSVRAYLPRAVPESTILEILDLARRAPSGGNVQPWHVDVLVGGELDRFRKIVAERIAAGAAEASQYEIYPSPLWEPHRSYRFELGEDMYRAAGIPRENKAQRLRQLAANYRFFDAPVGMFFSMSRRMCEGQWADLGMLMQTVMLLAVERGLSTCAQEIWSHWPDTVAAFLELDSDRILFAGMALGYADEAAPINGFRSARAELESFVTLRGFVRDEVG